MIGWLFACGDPELELRVEQIERRLEALESRGVPGVGSTELVTATPEQEQAAADRLRDASEAMKRLDWDTARAELEKIDEHFPNTRAARATVRLRANLDVIGKPERELAVERWFRGSADQVPPGGAKLIVFFEAWCSHCRRDLPRTMMLAEKYRDRLVVVGLTKMTKGATDEQMEAFLTELDVKFPVGEEQDDALSRHYGVLGIPAAVVVVGGVVVWRGSPTELEEATLETLLKGG